MYEDENDNYNYEKGFYSIIEFKWDDKNRKLVIDERKGDFPNIVKERNFRVILVSESSGKGVDINMNPAKIIHYDGLKKIVML